MCVATPAGRACARSLLLRWPCVALALPRRVVDLPHGRVDNRAENMLLFCMTQTHNKNNVSFCEQYARSSTQVTIHTYHAYVLFTGVVSSPALKQVSDECGWGEAEGWIPFGPWGGLEMDRVWRGSPPPTMEEWAEEGRSAALPTEQIPIASLALTGRLQHLRFVWWAVSLKAPRPSGHVKGFAAAVVFKCMLQYVAGRR